MTSQTLSIRIKCATGNVYAFVSNPRNLPKWATAFCRSVRKTGKKWIIETPQGAMGFRFVPKNKLGVLDHYVSPNPGTEIYVPMRVVPNGSNSEMLLTIFRSEKMTNKQFSADAAMVQRDLTRLKRILEDKD